MALLASCSGGGSEAGKRTDPKDLEPSPVKKVDKDKAAIEATMRGYARATKASLAEGRKLPPMARIRAVVAEPYATRYGRQLAGERSTGLVMRGLDVYTTRKVTVSGDRATLLTCWDGRGANVVNIYTKPVQVVPPAKPNLTTFLLKRVGDGWKITKRTPGKAC
jgi:hypothetical protein